VQSPALIAISIDALVTTEGTANLNDRQQLLFREYCHARVYNDGYRIVVLCKKKVQQTHMKYIQQLNLPIEIVAPGNTSTKLRHMMKHLSSDVVGSAVADAGLRVVLGERDTNTRCPLWASLLNVFGNVTYIKLTDAIDDGVVSFEVPDQLREGSTQLTKEIEDEKSSLLAIIHGINGMWFMVVCGGL